MHVPKSPKSTLHIYIAYSFFVGFVGVIFWGIYFGQGEGRRVRECL